MRSGGKKSHFAVSFCFETNALPKQTIVDLPRSYALGDSYPVHDMAHLQLHSSFAPLELVAAELQAAVERTIADFWRVLEIVCSCSGYFVSPVAVVNPSDEAVDDKLHCCCCYFAFLDRCLPGDLDSLNVLPWRGLQKGP